MKQTAVDWLFNRLWDTPKDKFTWHSILEQAKEMEKEQIEMSYKEGAFCKDYQGYTEQYYKQTYETNTESN